MANNTSHEWKLHQVVVMYKECHHNHAAQARGYILDGCGLFEPKHPNGTPESTTCAACGCHRSFHRRVVVDLPPGNNTGTENEINHENPSGQQHGPRSVRAPLPDQHQQTSASHTPPELSPVQEIEVSGRRKRITREQSERIRAVAERNNWKMFREYSEEEIGRICLEIGITRTALKSWIFNHRRKRATSNEAL